MKAYVVTTGAIFGLITAAHVARVIEEGRHLATEPFFVSMPIASTGLCIWAVGLLSGGRGSRA